MSDRENQPLQQKDSKQRTLFDLQKVVKLDSSAVCFSAANVAELRATLLDPNTGKYVLLTTLRKLDCLKFEFKDLMATEIGCAVATLTVHPKVEVAKLAHNLTAKWRALVDSILFKKLEYDAELAATVPEGEPPKAPAVEAAEAAAAEKAAAKAARRQAELDYLDSDGDFVESSSDEEGDDSGDDEWRPGGGKGRRGKGHVSGRAAKRRQSGQKLTGGSEKE